MQIPVRLCHWLEKVAELPWASPASSASVNEGGGGEKGDLELEIHPTATANGGVVFTFKKQRRNYKERS